MMALGSKARYATRIMVYLAGHGEGRPVSRHDIGEAEGISPDYVEQILVHLRTSQLVRSHRGRNGGFSLGRDPNGITLIEVLEAVEGPIIPAPCIAETCPREQTCPACDVWREVAETMRGLLGNITVAQMARRKTDTSVAAAMTYQI